MPAGLLLIIAPLIFTAGFTGLQMTFDYPDILRRPAGEVLTRFASAGIDLHIYWYAMTCAALALIPAAVLAAVHFWKRDAVLAGLASAFGILAGLVQALGLIRWVMLVPALASSYTAGGATDADRAMAAAIFDAANRYLGVGVGEHLGYLFTALWTLLISALIFQASHSRRGRCRHQPWRPCWHAGTLRPPDGGGHQRVCLCAVGPVGAGLGRCASAGSSPR